MAVKCELFLVCEFLCTASENKETQKDFFSSSESRKKTCNDYLCGFDLQDVKNKIES